MSSTLERARELHGKHIEPYLGAPLGCSAAEVAQLEDRLGVGIPDAYREFLLWMGKDETGIFKGSDCFHRHVEENTLYLPELLEENGIVFRSPGRSLAFFLHQGYIAAWFQVPTDDPDPMCWLFSEGSTDRPSKVGRFSEFLWNEMRGLAAVAPGIPYDDSAR
ncbi:MAG: SMI1/KNR4 family protein [Holophagales bacterium]|nr:SMI1/KNR4 family protein [Holophagales bacterium]